MAERNDVTMIRGRVSKQFYFDLFHEGRCKNLAKNVDGHYAGDIISMPTKKPDLANLSSDGIP